MNFNNNSGLSNSDIKLKETLIREILRSYTRAQDRKDMISSIPANSNIEQFVDGVKAVIDLDQASAVQRVILKDSHAAGTNLMQDPLDPLKELSGVVLYSMKKRAPGTLEGGNTWFDSGRKDVKPRLRNIVADKSGDQERVKLVYSQWFDNEIKFDIVARTNMRANELALWFEALMEVNRYFFAFKGITKYFMHERSEDGFKQYGNESFEYRPYLYYVRTERRYEITEETINRIVISLNKQ